jgi:16S rRNA (guanine527-N7)-methyltransferase
MVAAFRETLLKYARSTGLSLTDREIAGLTTHYRILQEWSLKMNLTGLRDTEAIVRRHFLEPMAVVDLLQGEGTLVDLGSGNGFPAIPLKILRPDLDLILVESSDKKSAFLWAVLREIGLRTARVETRRVNRLSDLSDLLPCRYLTMRAIRITELTKGPVTPVLQPGGKALLFVTEDQVEELQRRPLPGLRLTVSRTLPSDRRSRLAILEAERS